MTARTLKLVSRLLWACLGVYVCTLVYLTHAPAPPGVFGGVSDKKLHVIAYFLLATFSYLAAAVSFPHTKQLGMIVLFLGGIFGALDESTQPFFNRHAEFADWVADIAGLTLGVIACALVRRVTRAIARLIAAR